MKLHLSIRTVAIATGLVVVTVAMSGCSALPSAGPLASEVEADSGLSTPYESKGYVLVNVTPLVISTLAAQPVPPAFPPDFGFAVPDAGAIIGVGDGVTVSIWEAGAGGLFTSAPIQGFLPGARSVTVPEQIVAADGSISIPYAGRIHIAGLQPHQVEDIVQKQLTGKAIQPQVTVAVTHSLSSTVSVMGEVTSGGRLPMGPQGLRLLDAIATAGGIHIPSNQSVVRLSRGGKTVSIPFLVLLEHPNENVYLAPGDVITVVQQPETITAFGATGRNAIVPFETVSLSLEEAIAKSGGILDDRADPSGVYLFRYEPAALAARLAPTQLSDDIVKTVGPDGTIPVVYRLNLGTVTSYFQARSFAMRDKDIIYVADARLTQVQKFLALVDAVISPAVTGVTVGNAVK